MSWRVIAKKEVRNASCSRRRFALIVAFVLFFAGVSFVVIKISNFFQGNDSVQIPVIVSLTTPLGIFLPPVGIFSGYRSIVGERESESLKLLLSLPHTRTDVVLGKFIGRAAIVSLATEIGFLVGGAIIVALGATLAVTDYLVLVLLSLVLGATFVSVSVGVSAGLRSENLIVLSGFGLVVLFTLLWGVLTAVLGLILRRYGIGSAAFQTDLLSFIRVVNPQTAFKHAFSAVSAANTAPAANAFWQQGWFGFVVLALWIILPLAFGRWRFAHAELT